ncbi:hypothetical protein FB446DRAFT_619863, partial [Lentinula raphanica]
PPSMQCHLHINLHLSCIPQNIIPFSALDVLHAYKMKGIPTPMKTYSKVIGRMFATGPFLTLIRKIYITGPRTHQAWDFFSHMRYVAHPNPDVFLYTQMIRAC